MSRSEYDVCRRLRLTAKRNCRYPLKADMEYRLWEGSRLLETGIGRTVDVSSSGVLFESEKALPPGRQIKLMISWPAPRNHRPGLELQVRGRTVRAWGNCTAVEILGFDFRVRAVHTQADLQRALAAS